MSVLKNTKTYLCGHMQYIDNGLEWRSEATKQLNSIGISVFDPYNKPFVHNVYEDENTKKILLDKMESGDFNFVSEHMKQIRAYDLRCVDLSDFIIAKINPKIASWGSSDEIFTALRLRKPLFLIVDGGVSKTPLWLMGSMPCSFIFNSFDEVFEQLKKINNGEIVLDTKYWKLLKPEFR